MPVTVQVMHAERGLDSLAGVWRDLARETDAGPFQSYEWASSWWSAFGGDLHLAPALVRRDGAVRGLVPLVARAAPEGGEELVFLGTGMSDLLDWILAPDLDPRAVLAASGSAEISCRHRGSELVSAFVIMRHRRTRYYYQAALNPAYADLSPGTAHMAAEITRAIHDGMTALDLLRGDEPYKSRWSTATRHTHRFTTALPR